MSDPSQETITQNNNNNNGIPSCNDDVKEVHVDGLVVLQIIQQCESTLPALSKGCLLGLGENNQTLEDSFHLRWIDAYNVTEYQEITNWLINYVDSIQQKVDNKVANQIFQESLEFEFLFWESSWNIE